jgi:glycosyltransferase involved in cell wall biosynthesis
MLEFISSWLSTHIFAMNFKDLGTLSHFGLPKSRYSFLPNGVDLPDEINSDETFPDRIKFLFVGRFWEQKNPLFILESLKEMPCELIGKSTLWTFVGNGPLRDRMIDLKERDFKDLQMDILDWSDDVNQYYKTHDVLVMSSKWEGMPLVLLEAMSHSLCVVAPRISGIHDVIMDGKDGILYELGNAQEFISIIYKIVDKKISIKDFGIEARKKVQTSYTVDVHNSNLNLVYKA